MHAHAQNAAIFSLQIGEKPYLEVLSRFGLWCNNFCIETCQSIPNQWNFTSATLNDIRFFFYHNIKDNDRNLCQDRLKIRTRKCTRCIMQMIYLYASDFPFKNFCKIAAQHAEINNTKKCLGKELCRVLVVDNSTDHDKPHFDLFSATKKALRDTLTRAAWL